MPSALATRTYLVADLDHTAPWVAAILATHGGDRAWRLAAGGMAAVFESSTAAVGAAVDLRSAVVAESAAPTRLRIALHAGGADGPAVRRCAGLLALANGGQTLLSAVAAAGCEVPLADLGTHRLHDLSAPERVFELRADGAADSLPLRSIDRVPNNLPVHLTGFVGRDAELGAVRALLTGERLLTLTGPGGCGKTRLAARVAAESAERWPDGVWWVELAALTSPAQVAEVVATTAGVLVDAGPSAASSLARQLKDRRILLCLDNCEHILDGAAEVAAELARGCPEVAVLTTSREPLGVPGETAWPVPPLAGAEAESLFVERARSVAPSFAPDDAELRAVSEICTRLDGIPLAVELAAVWLRALTPQQIEGGLDDRFALLVRGPRGAVSRQRTLAASIDWSHDLLDDAERVAFRRFAVFAAGCTPAAAFAVCDADLGVLARLVDKSLVVADSGRYRMLETIREYAAERLRAARESADLRERHLDYYLSVVEANEPLLATDRDAWRAVISADYPNLRAAVEFGLAAPDPSRGRRLAAQLPWLWHAHRHGHEGLRFLSAAVERGDRSALQARLLTGIALVVDTASPLDLEYDAAQRALEIATELGDERLRCLPLALAAVGQFYTDFDAALSLNEQARQSAVAAGDEFVTDAHLALRGIIRHLRDEHVAASADLSAAAAGLLRRGDRGIASTVLSFQAVGALYTGSLATARSLAEEAVAVAAPLADYHRVGASRSVLALVLGATGDPGAGLALLDPIVEGFVPGLARVLGDLNGRLGDHAEAVRWLEREAWSTDRGAPTYLAAQARPLLASALRQLGRVDEASRVASSAVSLARELGMPRVLADALEQQGFLADDVDSHHEALAVRVTHGLVTQQTDSVDAIAAHLATRGAVVDAARALAASTRARAEMGYHRVGPAPSLPDVEAVGLAEAVAYVRRARGSRGRPESGWASLTPTELEVVRLAADGLNNPEIAARLFMSRGTVKTHLSHVYSKLGITNRTELAGLAARLVTRME